MPEITRITDQLHRTFYGEAWHGEPLFKLVSHVRPEEAVMRPLKGRHTIWELISHIAAWKNEVRRALIGYEIRSLSGEEDWPPVGPGGPEAWKEAIAELERSHDELLKAAEEFDEERLDETVLGASYSFYTMLHGVIQHDLYHAGQIAIILLGVRE